MTLAFAALSEFPLAAVDDSLSAAVGEAPIYLSTHGFNSAPDDEPPNTHFLGAIKRAPTISSSLGGGPNGFFAGQRVRTLGEVELANADGGLDGELARFAVDGRRLTVKAALLTRGSDGLPRVPLYRSFDRYYEGAALGWRFGERSVVLEFRANDFLLKIPVQTRTYAGNGGAEGGEDLTGRSKPLVFGAVENITPVLLKSDGAGSEEDGTPKPDVDLVYQVHDGRVEAIDAVYDGGVPLRLGRNFPDFASLNGAATDGGSYDTCRAEGLFKLATAPVFAVTCDVRGDSRTGYKDRVATIAKRLVADYASVPRKLIDHGSFASFDARQPATVGIYVAQAGVTVAQLLNELCQGVGAWWGFGRDGRLALGRVSEPYGRQAETYGEDDIVQIERLNLPYDRPHYKVTLGYRRNWTPNAGQLASNARKKQFRQAEYRYAVAEDPEVRRRNLLAKDDPPILSHFTGKTDAEKEAKRLLKLYGAPRALYKVTVKSPGYLKDVGDVVRIRYPRWDLKRGKGFLIVAVRADTSRNRVELTCFG